MNTNELLERNKICKICKVLEGSHAYGTAIETSDVDMRGIFCADQKSYLTPFFNIKEIDIETEEDTKYFELKHFMNLLYTQNPNILQLLWVRDQDIIETSPAYEYIRSVRGNLLSSAAARSTAGYANGELHKMKSHAKWISIPTPKTPPKQRDHVSLVQWFGDKKMLPSTFAIHHYIKDHIAVPYGNDIYGLYEMKGEYLSRKDGSFIKHPNFDRTTLNPLAIFKFNREEYQKSKNKHKNYWEWKKNRNPQRSILEEKYSYDCKNASHLVRLLRMSYEILDTHKVNVFREDADELLAIRNGSMQYDELLKYADDLDKKIKDMYNKTTLREHIDVKYIAAVMMRMQEMVWSKT